MNPIIFREYDIRGVYGQSLFDDDAAKIGAAYATYLAQKRPGKKLQVILGFDGRLSTPALKQALLRGLISQGVEVVSVGIGPTPMLYYAVHESPDADGGIMITGSHNPPTHNGFKMMIGKSSLFGSEIAEIGRIALSIDVPHLLANPAPVAERDVASAYANRMARDCAVGKKSLRVAWDAGNGAAGRILPDLAKLLPGKHVVLNEQVDGTFPVHHPDPSVEENMRQLQKIVLEKNLDVGFAFDGDGDRIGVVDNRGRIFWGDQILLFLAEDIIRQNQGQPIIADVKCSQILFDAIKKMGGQPVIWKTGHSLIKSKMAELSAPLAGEMSGHIFIKDQYYGFDDGLYSAVRFMRYLQDLPMDLASWRDRLPEIHNTPEMRIECEEARKFAVIDEVRSRLKQSGIPFLDVDGVRAVTENGWWVLRASNTQPVLALRCESNSPQGLQILQSQVQEQLAKSGIALKIASH